MPDALSSTNEQGFEPCKLIFNVGEKNRAQICLTVSNIKLDDVFSDVSRFITKVMKATDAEIFAAVDGEICAEQAEKLRIICFHMDSLELCRLNTSL